MLKIIRPLLLFTVAISIAFLFQSKPPTAFAAICYSGECSPNKYECQNKTMCCTGGGCPSAVCNNYDACYWSGGSCKRDYTYWDSTCVWHSGFWHKHCTLWHYTDGWYHCHSYTNHWHSGYWTGCNKTATTSCSPPGIGGSTCGWCTGNPPGGGGGGGCTWGASISPPAPASSCSQSNGLWGHYYRDNPANSANPSPGGANLPALGGAISDFSSVASFGSYYDGGLKLQKNDPQLEFSTGFSGFPQKPPLCDNNLSALWTGYINIPQFGNWRFGADSSDGFAIDLEKTPGVWTRVANYWYDHTSTAAPSFGLFQSSMSAGWYAIRFWNYKRDTTTGGAVAKLRYYGNWPASSGLSSVTPIPAAYLRSCYRPLTGPSNPGVTALTAVSAQLNWTPGSEGTKQLLRVGDNQTQVESDCPLGTGPGTGCVIKDDNVPSGQASYGTGGVLNPGTTYYWRVIEWLDAANWADFGFTPSFKTRADPWVKILNGLVHANHMTTLRVAPVGQNSRWLITSRGTITGTSQEGWIAQWYPERNFSWTNNTPIKAPTYDRLFKLYGKGANAYSGLTLPNADGVYLINGDKTVSAVFDQAGGANTLVFVDGDLTIDAEIRTAANGTIAFIVSGEIKFAKNLTGGGGGVDNVGGLYVAEDLINTAYDKSAPDEITRQLVVEGGLVSLRDTLSLDRNLDPTDNQTTPAEEINLSGKYYVLLKSVLGRPKFFWQEVPGGF